jgi:hypothetical protein
VANSNSNLFGSLHSIKLIVSHSITVSSKAGDFTMLPGIEIRQYESLESDLDSIYNFTLDITLEPQFPHQYNGDNNTKLLVLF